MLRSAPPIATPSTTRYRLQGVTSCASRPSEIPLAPVVPLGDQTPMVTSLPTSSLVSPGSRRAPDLVWGSFPPAFLHGYVVPLEIHFLFFILVCQLLQAFCSHFPLLPRCLEHKIVPVSFPNFLLSGVLRSAGSEDVPSSPTLLLTCKGVTLASYFTFLCPFLCETEMILAPRT